MLPEQARLARETRGFMPENEGMALYDAASTVGLTATGDRQPIIVEIGAWCGKSTVYLGTGAKQRGALLISLDHHRGSEEQQPGWEHFDDIVVDADTGRIDTLPFWRRTVERAGIEDCVIGIVGDSTAVASIWNAPIDMCFIDGGHSETAAWGDFNGWSPFVRIGGLLAIHDVFPDPQDGGRPPFEIYQAALKSGSWIERICEGSLRILERISAVSD